MDFRHLCGRIAARLRVRTRYTRALEDEIARLRAENRALVNSILGVAGMPPVRARAVAGRVGLFAARTDEKTPADAGAARLKTGPTKDVDADARAAEEDTGAECNDGGRNAALRRRSWQQIGRLREIEDARAARRERETDTETFPTPQRVVPRV